MGSRRSEPSTQRVVQESNTDPWSGQQPHLKNVFTQAENLSKEPLSYFGGQTFAGFTPETEAALGLQTARALGGNVAQNNANTHLASTLSGDYLNAGNPHFATMANRIKGEVLPAIDRKWGAAGRLGSGLHARAAGLALGDSIGGLAHADYGDERTRMIQGTGLAPGLAAADYADIGRLGEVGGVREDLAQQGINEAIARHDFNQMEPWQRLALYQGAISGNFGGSTTGSTIGNQFLPRRSVGQGALGGALSGASLGGMLGGPWGAGVGGLAGLGLGLFA